MNSRYRNFYELCKELESQGRRFDKETLKLLSYNSLDLACIGNAGKAWCDYEIVEQEKKLRIEAIIEIPIEYIEGDKGKWIILDDISMYYAYYREKAKRFEAGLSDAPKWRLLVEEMKNLRDDWSNGRDNLHLKRIYELLPQVIAEGIVPLGWCEAVKANADEFDGNFNDGRIMRDGKMRLTKNITEQFGLPSTDVSGNMAKLLGAKPEKRPSGYKGSYEELFEDILSPSDKIIYFINLDTGEW